ncbi:hypothetical protein FQR65_LT10577 [Abscondita terminalis]|nr:hypothetical protein FQR65_LT10577 [Abscondita terminalis]
MTIRTLTPELQIVANCELNEDVNRLDSDLEQMKQWIKKQSYLNSGIDEQLLVNFLRGCKWSLQRTKDKINNFFKIRAILPDYFQNRDPFLTEIQILLDKGAFLPLPKTLNNGGPRICLLKCSNLTGDENMHVFCKLFFMILDILLNEDDNFIVSGMILLIDYRNIPLKIVTQLTPGLSKKYLLIFEKAYPLRIKNFIGMNTMAVVDLLYNNFAKALLSEKLRSRLLLASSDNINLVYNKVDKSLFPIEYGGNNGSIEELTREWKLKIENHREWFLEDSKKLSIEKMRFDKLETYSEMFGMEGSFRKLIID